MTLLLLAQSAVYSINMCLKKVLKQNNWVAPCTDCHSIKAHLALHLFARFKSNLSCHCPSVWHHWCLKFTATPALILMPRSTFKCSRSLRRGRWLCVVCAAYKLLIATFAWIIWLAVLPGKLFFFFKPNLLCHNSFWQWEQVQKQFWSSFVIEI